MVWCGGICWGVVGCGGVWKNVGLWCGRVWRNVVYVRVVVECGGVSWDVVWCGAVQCGGVPWMWWVVEG